MGPTTPSAARPDGNRGVGPAELRAAVAGLLGVAPADLDDRADLTALGLESVAVMRMVNVFRRAGVLVTFDGLIEEPTVERWLALLPDAAAVPRDTAVPHREPVDEHREHPLAPMQQAYWIGGHDGQLLGGVSAHFYAEFDGAGVEPDRLTAAVHALFARHGMLRARFTPDGRQQVLARTPWSGLTVYDLRGPTGAETAATLRTTLSHRRFDVEAGDVLDVRLSLLDHGRTRVHIGISMLVADAQSYQIILSDLCALYRDPHRRLPPLNYSFARYLADEREHADRDVQEAADYWHGRLAELPGAPQLPLASGAATRKHEGVTRYHHLLSAGDVARLAGYARTEGLTLPVVFCTLYAEVLARWSAEPRFLLNLPTFGRRELHNDVSLMVGDFTNVTVLSVDVDEPATFTQRAAAIQARLRGDLVHSAYSGVEVLRELARRTGGGLPAPVVFTSAIGLGPLFGSAVRECLGTPVWTSSETPQVWLDQQVIDNGDGGLLINWDVTDGVFPAGLVDALTDAYGRALTQLVAAADHWQRPLVVPLPDSQAATRARVNETGPARRLGLLHDRFFEWATTHPDATALAWGETGELGYGELADRALRIAGGLRAAGVVPGDLVGVTAAKGAWQIAIILGVLAAGAVYVPVGIDQPARRRERMYRKAGVRCVVGIGDERAPSMLDVRELARCGQPSREHGRRSDDELAYVIHTSGSTGEPKGVEISHRAAMNTIQAINDHFGICREDRTLALSAVDFDLSVYDIFGPLSVGGAVVLVDESDRKEAPSWGHLVRQRGVTVWNSVPALLDMFLAGGGVAGPGDVPRVVLVSGDWVAVNLPARVRALRPDVRFAALGGATEAAIWSNLLEVDDVPLAWTAVPYGYPLRGQRFRVVDRLGRDQPDWVAGELWIGGSGVAGGYRNAPDLTAAAFVHADGARWYRTGDLARYLPDGMVEFLGRLDNQVKIGGHRIELGEIEAALERQPGVQRAVAFAVGSPSRGIAAAVLGRHWDRACAGRVLARDLPSYMVPARIVAVDELPLTATGKVDRRRLARLVEGRMAAVPREQPDGATERALAAIWTEVLGKRGLGRLETFFGAGGDSLQATRMLQSVRNEFGVAVTLRQFFAAPTIVDLAAVIDAERTVSGEFEEGRI